MINSKKKTALLIEGELSLLSTLQEGLEEQGIHVEPATHIDEAIRKIDMGGIRVVVLDLHLPGGESIKLLPKLIQHAQSVPVVVLSDVGDEQIIQEAIRMGIHSYVVKTKSSLDQVLSAIHRVVG